MYVYLLCLGQSCLSLMQPRNGNFTCDGPQITGTVCSFDCNLGYNLAGSKERECLSNNEWSGNTTTCEILHCDGLNNQENSRVILPCNTRLGTYCKVECSPGFYTNATNRLQKCQLTPNNVAVWSQPPQCIGMCITHVLIEFMKLQKLSTIMAILISMLRYLVTNKCSFPTYIIVHMLIAIQSIRFCIHVADF